MKVPCLTSLRSSRPTLPANVQAPADVVLVRRSAVRGQTVLTGRDSAVHKKPPDNIGEGRWGLLPHDSSTEEAYSVLSVHWRGGGLPKPSPFIIPLTALDCEFPDGEFYEIFPRWL